MVRAPQGCTVGNRLLSGDAHPSTACRENNSEGLPFPSTTRVFPVPLMKTRRHSPAMIGWNQGCNSGRCSHKSRSHSHQKHGFESECTYLFLGIRISPTKCLISVVSSICIQVTSISFLTNGTARKLVCKGSVKMSQEEGLRSISTIRF